MIVVTPDHVCHTFLYRFRQLLYILCFLRVSLRMWHSITPIVIVLKKRRGEEFWARCMNQVWLRWFRWRLVQIQTRYWFFAAVTHQGALTIPPLSRVSVTLVRKSGVILFQCIVNTPPSIQKNFFQLCCFFLFWLKSYLVCTHYIYFYSS